MGATYGSQLWDPTFWEPVMGAIYGSRLCERIMRANYGSQLWVPIMGAKHWEQIMGADYGSKLKEQIRRANYDCFFLRIYFLGLVFFFIGGARKQSEAMFSSIYIFIYNKT